MKKRYLVLAIVLATILILPKYISTQVSSNIDQYITQLNNLNGYSAEVVELNEGWFSSNGLVKVKFALASLGQGDDSPWSESEPEVLLEFVSHHGPVIFTDGVDIGLINWDVVYAGDVLRSKLEWPEETNFYELSINSGLFGAADLEDRIVPFTVNDQSTNQNVVFSGYEGEGKQSSDEFSYEGKIETFQFTSDEGKFEVGDVYLSMTSEGEFIAAMNGEMFDSSALLTMDKLEILTANGTQQSIDLNKLSFEVDTNIDEKEELVNISQKMTVENVSAMNYDVSDFKLNIETNRISLVFLKAYQEFAKSLSKLNENEMKQQSMVFFQQNLLSLLKSQPQINISDFSATLPEGKFVAYSNNQLIGIDALPTTPEDPKFWLEHTVSDTKLELDKGVANLFFSRYMISQLQLNPQTAGMSPEEIELIAAQQVPNMIEGLKAQGFITEEDDKLKMHFSLKDGAAMLNGNAIPLPY